MYLLVLLLVGVGAGPVAAQILTPVRWQASVEEGGKNRPTERVLVVTGLIDKGWHVYGPDFDTTLGPIVLRVAFEPQAGYRLKGGLEPVGAKRRMDEIFGGELTEFSGRAVVRQRIVLTGPALAGPIRARVEGQACTDADGRCVTVSGDLTFAVAATSGATPPPTTEAATTAGRMIPTPSRTPGTATVPAPPAGVGTLTEGDTAALATAIPPGGDALAAPVTTRADTAGKGMAGPTPLAGAEQAVEYAPGARASGAINDPRTGSGGLLGFFFLAFGAGLLALLTPCVYPMIPMTVSFFTRSGGTRARAIAMALAYGLSIILIYEVVGVGITKLAGPEVLNFLSTHWLPNVLFFGVFVLFGLSFLGYFEIVLPSRWTTATDAQADKGGLVGIFFMALTLVLVSFSCTAPVSGSILLLSFTGETLRPMVGMLGFSLAFALPFTLFALFPGWVSSLPRSGGWLNQIKVVLGFIELAFALKFLSVADQVYHWGLLDRPVYLSLWIVIAVLLGAYLVGWLRFPHDADHELVDPTTGARRPLPALRLLGALTSWAFALYLVPGLLGAPLPALSGYLPPAQAGGPWALTAYSPGTAPGAGIAADATALCGPPRHEGLFKLPHGLKGYYDLDQALACSRQTGKPVFVDFTGHGCVNCREMEARVWPVPAVLERLSREYIVVALYVDDKTTLPAAEHYTSTYDGRVKGTIGSQNADLQITRFGANAQPYYCLLDGQGRLLTAPRAYDLDATAFAAFLDEGLAAYRRGAAAPATAQILTP